MPCRAFLFQESWSQSLDSKKTFPMYITHFLLTLTIARHLGGVQTPLSGSVLSVFWHHSQQAADSSGPSLGARGMHVFSLGRHVRGTSLRGTTLFSAIAKSARVSTDRSKLPNTIWAKVEVCVCFLFNYLKIHLFHAYCVPVSSPMLDLLHRASHLILRFLWHRNYFYLYFMKLRLN